MNIEKFNLSQKQINKIGKKFRDNIYEDEDINILEFYRSSYDEILIDYINQITSKIKNDFSKFIITGRLKRTYSIIRKLKRKNNHGMDLTRMSDIAGLRIIVQDLNYQKKIIDLLNGFFNIEKIYDYRDSEKNYKSVHLIIKNEENKLIEIQIRTMAQQTWADESETFGEQAKQGIYQSEVGEYLKVLSDVCNKIDNEEDISNHKIENDIYNLKSPINGKYVRLSNFFNNFEFNNKFRTKYYLIVYDAIDNSLVSEDEFYLDDKKEIYDLYKYKTKILDENRFEIIFFISSLGKQVLKITHPRFFISNQYIK